MDERERLEQYLAWRQVERRNRRRRMYRRLRLVGGVVTLALLASALGVGLAGWPRAAKRDVAGLPAPSPRVEPRTNVSPPAPSLSTREARPSDIADETPSTPPPSPERVASPPRLAPRPRVPAAPRTTASAASRSDSSGEPSAPAASGSSEPARRSADGTSAPGTAPAAPTEVIVTSAPAREVVVTPQPPTVIVERAPAPKPTVIVEPPARPAAPATVPGPAASAPPIIAAPAPAAPPAIAPPSDEPLERLKRLTGYIPEVWLARSISRWMKAQPPGELGPPPSERELPQAR